ncbi:hypothetical protein L345_06132, partial [Ophiophagus hannah]
MRGRQKGREERRKERRKEEPESHRPDLAARVVVPLHRNGHSPTESHMPKIADLTATSSGF